MNGADALIETFLDNGVTACFAIPGASEMRSARRKRAGRSEP